MLQINSPDSAMIQAIETQITAHVKAFENYVNGLTGCTGCLHHLRFTVLEKVGRVRIHLDVPGGELTIDKQNRADLPLAISQAFTTARERLEEYVHKIRHDVKVEGSSPDLRVTTIFSAGRTRSSRNYRRAGNLFSSQRGNRSPKLKLEVQPS